MREVIGTDSVDVCLRETELLPEQAETFFVPLRIMRSKLEHLAFHCKVRERGRNVRARDDEAHVVCGIAVEECNHFVKLGRGSLLVAIYENDDVLDTIERDIGTVDKGYSECLGIGRIFQT